MLTTALIAVIVCLLALIIWLLYRLFSFKSAVKEYTKEIEKLNDDSYKQPLKVDFYDKDIVGLANVLNAHIEQERELHNKNEQNRKELSNIISGISHDFRTPLTASLGYLQMIEKSDSLSDEQAEYLSVAISKNNYLKELSDDFFEISKLDKTQQELEIESVNLSNMFSELTLQQHQWINEQGIDISIDIPDGIIVSSNSHALQRIIENLYSNTKKYAVSYLGAKLSQENGTVTLCVYNDTEEIDAIDESLIFEPFHRSNSRTKSGSGLGLYVCKILIGKLGGKIYAEKHRNELKIIIEL